MGSSPSSSAAYREHAKTLPANELAKVSKKIDRDIEKEKTTRGRIVKLLLLGTGGSGKSTLAKQMKILRAKGFDDAESEFFKQFIHQNLVTCLHFVVNSLVEANAVEIDQQMAMHVRLVSDLARSYVDVGLDMDDDIRESVMRIWNMPTLQEQLTQIKESFDFPDCGEYYLDQLPEILNESYIPSQDDIIRCRIVTRRVAELPFSHKGMNFILIDVGGQRTERRKWLHYFDDVSGILFVVALSEYYQTLEEDSTVNRMEESLRVFEDISNNKLFRTTPMLLFFNKQDVFVKKLNHHKLATAFPSYTGDNSYDDASKFIKEMFDEVKSTNIKSYVHFTDATDTSNIEYVFNDCLDIIMKANIKNTGIE